MDKVLSVDGSVESSAAAEDQGESERGFLWAVPRMAVAPKRNEPQQHDCDD